MMKWVFPVPCDPSSFLATNPPTISPFICLYTYQPIYLPGMLSPKRRTPKTLPVPLAC